MHTYLSALGRKLLNSENAEAMTLLNLGYFIITCGLAQDMLYL